MDDQPDGLEQGVHGIVEATREVEKDLPFELLGFDSDKRSEFLNWQFLRYFRTAPRRWGSPAHASTRRMTMNTWSMRTEPMSDGCLAATAWRTPDWSS